MASANAAISLRGENKELDRHSLYLARRAEDRLLKRRWQKIQEENQIEASTRKFNRVVLRANLDQENQALTEYRNRLKKMQADEEEQLKQTRQSRLQDTLKWEEEQNLQRKLEAEAITAFHQKQIKEKKEMKEQERLQGLRDAEILRGLDKRDAEEQRRHAVLVAESKKKTLKQQEEDIARKILIRQRANELLRKEEERTKRIQFEREEKFLKLKTEEVERRKKLQIPKQIVLEKLAALKSDKAAQAALREEQQYAKEVARKEAELAKQQKVKREKKAVVRQSLAAHRESQILERTQKENAERQSSTDWLAKLKEADRLSVIQHKLKLQKMRDEKIKLCNFNASVAAEKRVQRLQQEREERNAAVMLAEQVAAEEKRLRQHVGRDPPNAADNLNLFKERQRLGSSFLPPIPTRPRVNLVANDANSGRLDVPSRAESSSRLSTVTVQLLPRPSKAYPQIPRHLLY